MQTPRPRSRRDFLRFAAGLTGSALIAACSQTPPPAPTQAPAATTAPKPTTAPAPTTAPGAPTTAPAPTAVATAAPKPAATTAPGATPAAAQPSGLKAVPRNRTMIMAGLGGEHPGGFTDVDNYNIWLPGFSRSGYSNIAAQPLFYYNMMNDQFIPWNGESYAYNSGYTEVTVKVRQGVTWSDGKPFTAKDIAFTINTVKNTHRGRRPESQGRPQLPRPAVRLRRLHVPCRRRAPHHAPARLGG
jgi:ABC-type transport system substrate-binding protein